MVAVTVPALSSAEEEVLVRIFHRATELGLLGPREADHVIGRSHAYAAHLPGPGSTPVRVADLGSGAGVPGLVLAVAAPWVAVEFVEISERRCAFLRWAVRELAVAEGRSESEAIDSWPDAPGRVVHADASDLGHDPAFRERFDAVVARSFRSPVVTAETASGLLRFGGHLIVSGTPDDEDRWPVDALMVLGLEITGVDDSGPLRLRTMTKTSSLTADRPRPIRSIDWG